jgi:hypothetical protein
MWSCRDNCGDTDWDVMFTLGCHPTWRANSRTKRRFSKNCPCAPGWWLTYPSDRMWVRQLGWWHSQHMESHKSHVPKHQPVSISFILTFGQSNMGHFPMVPWKNLHFYRCSIAMFEYRRVCHYNSIPVYEKFQSLMSIIWYFPKNIKHPKYPNHEPQMIDSTYPGWGRD